MMDPAHDREGVKQALLQLLEEGLAFRRAERRLDPGSDITAEALAKTMPRRELTPGYYRVGEYLLWLETRIKYLRLGAGFTAADVDGLCAIDAARGEFEYEHPICPSCGERQDNRFWLRCCECGYEVKR